MLNLQPGLEVYVGVTNFHLRLTLRITILSGACTLHMCIQTTGQMTISCQPSYMHGDLLGAGTAACYKVL